MHLRLHRVLLLLLSTWLTVSFCFSLHDDKSSFAPRDETKWLAPVQRGYNPCRSRCSPKSCCQLPPSASNEEDSEGVFARSLSPRALFAINKRTINAEIVRRFTEERVKLIYHSDGDSVDSTSAWKPITPKSRAFDLGLSGLCGCTGLIVHSKNGAYGAHFFEDPAWGSGDDNFRKYVEDFLKNSEKGSGGLAEFANRLIRGNADVAAYILTPRKELLDAQGATIPFKDWAMYPEQVQQLVDLLPEIIPRLQDHIQVNDYQALDGMQDDNGKDINPAEARLLDTTARGRILLQYDPRNNGFRTIRLFFETKLIFNRQLGVAAGPN